MSVFGYEWYIVSLVCFAIYFVGYAIERGDFIAPLRSGEAISMCIVSVLPFVNIVIAVLSVAGTVALLYTLIVESMHY